MLPFLCRKGHKCTLCNNRYHDKCAPISKSKGDKTKKENRIFICSHKCYNKLLPFSEMNNKDFFKLNVGKIKNPCRSCGGACFKKAKLDACCKMCNTWYHLKCKHKSKKELKIAKRNRLTYYCSKKCELKIMPFNMKKKMRTTIFLLP